MGEGGRKGERQTTTAYFGQKQCFPKKGLRQTWTSFLAQKIVFKGA